MFIFYLLKTSTCTAGAGTLILEFGTLSRLTGNPIYEVGINIFNESKKVAKKSMMEVWERRSPLGIVGNEIDMVTGKESLIFSLIDSGFKV